MNDQPDGYKAFLLRFCSLVGVGILISVTFNLFRSHPLEWSGSWASHIEAIALRDGVTPVDLVRVKEWIDSGSHLIMDARDRRDFEVGHIPSAVSVPIGDIDTSFREVQLLLGSKNQPILVYCSGKACDESLRLSKFLRGQGYHNVSLYSGGFSEWSARGEKIEK